MRPSRHGKAADAGGRGFTLTELLVVITLLGLLAALGYPAYTGQLRKSRRADGMTALLELAAHLEGYYADHGSYAGAAVGSAAGALFPATSPGGYYTLGIDTLSATGYTISATPTRRQGQHRDRCGRFTLTSLGVRAAGNPDARCWR